MAQNANANVILRPKIKRFLKSMPLCIYNE